MKKLGFGCMRFPMVGEEVDLPQVIQMVDAYMEAGFCYFDTAHGYINEKSEPALKAALTSRYPRESYILTDKLSGEYFKSREDIRPFFEKQLETCGVSYFDYYLMHALGGRSYQRYCECGAFEVAAELKAEGKIRHMGISFHDSAQVLDRILTEQPQIEVVQLQFNYFDFESPSVQSKACWEVARKHGKPVIVMEPVRGGNLADLPPEAAQPLAELNGGSQASYAIRFAASFEGVMMVLSGMSSLEQMEDNLSYMEEFVPLEEKEYEALREVNRKLGELDLVQCTACRYCVDGCPKQIRIPSMFRILNNKRRFRNWDGRWDYGFTVQNRGKASDCIACGKCEASCPQHLPIRSLLKEVADIFESK